MQKFYIKAENADNPLETFEIVLDLQDYMDMLIVFLKDKRNGRIGRKLADLLLDTNKNAQQLFAQRGIKYERK